MKHWMVATPTYWVMMPILDDGTGPSEPGADVVIVHADTKRKAKVEGVRELRRQYSDGYLSDTDNPFVGLVVEEIPPCEHGRHYCREECEECALEAVK